MSSMTIQSAVCVSQIDLLLKILQNSEVFFHSCPYEKTNEFHTFAGYNLFLFLSQISNDSAVIL